MSVFHSNLAANLSGTMNITCLAFPGGENEMMAMPTDEESPLAPVNRFRNLVRDMEHLLLEIHNLQGNDPEREPELTPSLYNLLGNRYENIKNRLQTLKEIHGNLGGEQYSPYPEINQAVDIFLGSNPETWLDRDLQEINIKKQSAQSSDRIRNFLAEVTGDVTVGQEPESNVEYLTEKRMIPNAILCSGDSVDLASFYLSNEQNLQNTEKEYLKHRMRTIQYVRLKTQQNQMQDKKLTKITESGSGKNWELSMPDLQLYEHQSSGNGCWSCSYQLLLQSRGVFLDQKTIRAFRPGVTSADTMQLSSAAVEAMLGDKMGSPFEMADLTMKLLPNTAMFNKTLSLPTDYMVRGNPHHQSMLDAFNQTVEKALKQNKSPVSLSNSGHFLTIVGRRQDGKWQIRNSSDHNPTNYEYLSTEDLIKWSHDSAQAHQNPLGTLQLTWLKDLTPRQDGSCPDLDSDGFRRVHFADFTSEKGTGLLHTEGEADSDSALSPESHIFLNRYGDPLSLQITESVSVPTTLNPNVHLGIQENFVKGPEFFKWHDDPVNRNVVKNIPRTSPQVQKNPPKQTISEGWEEFSLFSEENIKQNSVENKGETLLPTGFPDPKPLSYISKEQFNQKIKTDPDFKNTFELLSGQQIPEWSDIGERPEHFTEPMPVAPSHGVFARFGNWVRKIFTGVDRYAEEEVEYRQNLGDWDRRKTQSENAEMDYEIKAQKNEIFNNVYEMIKQGWEAEQQANLPAFRNVRKEFRQRTENNLRAAMNDLNPEKIAAACAGVLADRYLADSQNGRENGPMAYGENLNLLTVHLTETITSLLNQNENLLNSVVDGLMTADNPVSREEGIVSRLDSAIKAQYKVQQQKSGPEKVTNPEKTQEIFV